MFERLRNALEPEKKVVKIVSPVEGTVTELSMVPDPAFNEEMFGKGVAIQPSSGRIVSPVNGTVSQMFYTGHAVSLISNDGAEILIHIGLDTVRLKGKHFTARAKTGDSVQIGDVLIDFDLEAIAADYDTITPIVICNSEKYKQFDLKTNINVKIGDEIILLGE